VSESQYDVSWGGFEPFGIDDDELDGLSPQQCFVLGYELAQIATELESGAYINKPIHPENRDRLERFAAKRNRSVKITAFDDNWFNLKTTDTPPRDGGENERSG
jgi:hypothetical protein